MIKKDWSVKSECTLEGYSLKKEEDREWKGEGGGGEQQNDRPMLFGLVPPNYNRMQGGHIYGWL